MALPTPRSLSPSKAEAFRTCPLAFRFSVIDRRPEPATAATALGTLVHRALEGLFWHHDPAERTLRAAREELEAAWAAAPHDPELVGIDLGGERGADLRARAETLVAAYFELEDPRRVRDVAVEATIEADVAGVRLRGIIDRLDVDPAGGLVVVDYKTGRVPGPQAEQSRLAGVQLYALLCQTALGQRPVRLRLYYLAGPTVIEAVPTEQGLSATGRRAGALWQAIERACATEDFRPRPSVLCGWCAFRSLCPAQGAPADRSAALDADVARSAGPQPVVGQPTS